MYLPLLFVSRLHFFQVFILPLQSRRGGKVEPVVIGVSPLHLRPHGVL